MVDAFKVGTNAKADCIVTVAQAPELSIQVKTKDAPLVGKGIHLVAVETLSALQVTEIAVEIADEGSLNYVLAGRIEAAVRLLFPQTPRLVPQPITATGLPRDRLRRTRLYVPGSNPRLQVGAELHGGDAVLLDLEDSVAPAEKYSARILVKHLMAQVPFDEVWVRINPLDTFGLEDLPEVMAARPNAICLPKAECADDILKLDEMLNQLELQYGWQPGSTGIVPILETAKGVCNALEIAQASPRMLQVCFGAEDYTRDVGAARVPEALLLPRCQVVQAAKIAGVQASDTVYSDVDDDEGLKAETLLAKNLGFDGKGVINPRQIEVIHDVFAPTAQEIEYARKVVAVAAEAEAQGKGAVALGSKMIDKPVLERAKRTLHLAQLMRLEGSR